MGEEKAIGVGTWLAGRYELVQELADGAMGSVYEATDHQSGDRVAVKVLHARHLADDAMRRRFRREGAVLKALDHPSLVRLLELEVNREGVAFFVTELVEAETLADRLVRGPLSLPEADALVSAVCGALAAAHAHGVLHGDLKPANVLWGDLPRLVDFSASKVFGLDRLTATGEISGTPAYMAPEVLTGKAQVDERIDVYGVGVLCYEALSATRAFAEEHVGRLVMKIDAGDCLPLDAVADVPVHVSEVVAKAMCRNKLGRHETVSELFAAWQRARNA